MRIYGKTEQMEIMLDTDDSKIQITQRWKCNFTTAENHHGQWDDDEKREYRRRVRDILDNIWGRTAYAIVMPNPDSKFSSVFERQKFTFKPKIEFTNYGHDWEVEVLKFDSFKRDSWVNWAERKIQLTNFGVVKDRYGVLASFTDPKADRWAVAHEYGHTIGNVDAFGTGDEYRPQSPAYRDYVSVMNLGSQVRTRHFQHIRGILHEMCPGVKFDILLH